MRVLLTSWAWPTHYYWLNPVAWACRAAGHEVLLAVPPAAAGPAGRGGVPTAAVGADFDPMPIIEKYYWSSPIGDLAARGEDVDLEAMRAAGEQPLGIYAILAEVMQDALVELIRSWRPDLLVFDAVTYAGPLAAAVCGVPAIRQIWGVDYSSQLAGFADAALARHRARLGLDTVDVLGAATLDPCPPSLQLADGLSRRPTRYPPYNGPGRLPGWLARPGRRPRICVTWGTVSHVLGDRMFPVPRVLEALSGLDAEVVAAVAPRDLPSLSAVPANVRVAANLPLHLLLPSCDLVVSQGGAGAVAAAIDAGLPQVAVPHLHEHLLNSRQVVAAGAAELVALDEAEPATVRDAVTRVLGSARHREAARRIQAELHDQPRLADRVTELSELARGV